MDFYHLKEFGTDIAAKILHVKRAAVYAAIRKGRLACSYLPNIIGSGRAIILTHKNLEEYRRTRYKRKSPSLGKGYITLADASRKFKVSMQRFYHLIRMKRMPYVRQKSAYILKEQDVVDFLQKDSQSSS